MKTLGALCGAVTLILLALTPGAVAADRVGYALPSLATQEDKKISPNVSCNFSKYTGGLDFPLGDAFF